jgi:hypothetical protein
MGTSLLSTKVTACGVTQPRLARPPPKENFLMSRTTLTSAVLSAIVALALAAPAPVPATQPQDVAIEAHTERDCPRPASCVFAATGAITDFGTVTTNFVLAGALGSPIVGTAQYVKTFHGQAGSLSIRLNSMITGTDDPMLFDEQGHWVIVSGSGAYSGLLGQGDESGVRDFANQSLDAVYTGQIH